MKERVGGCFEKFRAQFKVVHAWGLKRTTVLGLPYSAGDWLGSINGCLFSSSSTLFKCLPFITKKKKEIPKEGVFWKILKIELSFWCEVTGR